MFAVSREPSLVIAYLGNLGGIDSNPVIILGMLQIVSSL